MWRTGELLEAQKTTGGKHGKLFDGMEKLLWRQVNLHESVRELHGWCGCYSKFRDLTIVSSYYNKGCKRLFNNPYLIIQSQQ